MRRPLLLLSLLVATAACFDPTSPGRSVVLQVSEVVAPEEQASDEPLTVTLTVVTGGCTTFDRVVSTRTTNRITLEARGWNSARRDAACPADIRYEQRTYQANPPFADPLTIAVVQPDGTETIREVIVY